MSALEPVAAAVAALVFDDDRLLLGKRYEQGEFKGWQCPGGYIQQGETLQESIERICDAKAGVRVSVHHKAGFTNNIFSGNSNHTVTLYLYAHFIEVTNENAFKGGRTKWQWFAVDALPAEKFLPLELLLQEKEISVG